MSWPPLFNVRRSNNETHLAIELLAAALAPDAPVPATDRGELALRAIESAGCVTEHAAAALPKCRCSASAVRYLNCFKVIMSIR